MKASLSSVGFVVAALALALVAADPVANETEVVVLDAVWTNDETNSCATFSQSLSRGQAYAIYTPSCYYSSQVNYEGSYDVDTYTSWSYDSYSVYYGDQACEGSPTSFTYFSYYSAQYSDHVAHTKLFGPYSSYYVTFRPKVMLKCDNSVTNCYLDRKSVV